MVDTVAAPERSRRTPPAPAPRPNQTSAPPTDEPEEEAAASRPSRPIWVDLAVAAVLAGGLLVRFWAESPLWLDEALSVNIAKLPIEELTGALRHDGSPPLYYAVLHFWMEAFGSTDYSVRALSAVLSVASLPLMWLAGARLAGREAAWIGTVILAASPFALRFATETRMYSMIVFLTLLGFLALDGFLRRPTTPRLAGVMAVSAMLVLTHYWALFVLPLLLLALALHADGAVRRMPSSWALLGITVGSLAILPWLPTLIYQLGHTGTPWAKPAGLSAVLTAVFSFSGGDELVAPVLGLLMMGVAALGTVGQPIDSTRVVLDLRGKGPGKGLALVTLGTLVAGVGAGLVTGSAFAPRYASVVLVPFLLLVTLGTQALGSERGRRSVVTVIVLLSMAAAVPAAVAPRTQAGDVAAVLNQVAGPDDLVVFCPDQLGPAVHRYIGPRLRQVTFPRLADPRWVDWVDYEQHNRQTDSGRFARHIHRLAGRHDIWLVWASGYRGVGIQCERLDAHLTNIRPITRHYVAQDPGIGPEHQSLTRFSVPAFQSTAGPSRR